MSLFLCFSPSRSFFCPSFLCFFPLLFIPLFRSFPVSYSFFPVLVPFLLLPFSFFPVLFPCFLPATFLLDLYVSLFASLKATFQSPCASVHYLPYRPPESLCHSVSLPWSPVPFSLTHLFSLEQMQSDEIDANVQVGLGLLFHIRQEYDKAVDCFQTALDVR